MHDAGKHTFNIFSSRQGVKIVLNGGRKIQCATVGTKVKHWKGLVSVSKGPTKFQKVTNYAVLIVLKQGTPHGNIQLRRNGNTKACVIIDPPSGPNCL